MLKLTYHGHSCFELESDGHRIIVDPFLSDNPHAKASPKDIKVEAVLVSHGHGDHLGNAEEIARNNNCPIISNYEIANYLADKGLDAFGMHIGGSFEFDWGRLKLTPALHGSALPDGSYGGNPAGFLIWMGGKCVYYAGDTGIMSDMELYGRLNPIDFAMLPIGSCFTMDVRDAVEAALLLKPKEVMPIHYNTFPVIEAEPEEFAKLAQSKGLKTRIVEFGDTVEI
ncbi:MAG: metal-dependent hydrolase [Acidobacteriota bacterium]|jgi:L-ascorbate metabolism protein UlaG (beta-lactamase superfamily)